jgi:outer membrane protein
MVWMVVGGLVLSTMGLVEAAESFKVGVIQQRQIIEKTKAGKRALETLQEYQAVRQRILAEDDEELKRLDNELKAQQGGMNEQERREKQERLRIKLENYQRRVQEFTREIQQKQQELTQEFQKKIDEAVRAVAEKNGFAAVIDEGGAETIQIVLYAHPSINLTEQVIKEFDRRNK